MAALDEEVMIHDKSMQAQAYLKNLEHLFNQHDRTNNGVSAADLAYAMENPRVQVWFSSIGIDASAQARLFELLDDGDGIIRQDEFTAGIKDMAGAAKETDVVGVVREQRKLVEKLTAIEMCLKEQTQI